ncbi:hypothetical protein H6G89_18245 [Oscillatoria sp. FACHB-1407]|uniref:hypothetical protein n=1 Tax=Oscillatoria sp. FACHB-1407 TaxID=2692847 RepID=UPI0016855EB9|nr:hypothetical protein [Oscillatoria sp. FACHB-1407]MBD2462984.1 hypothetical protein [Oscillatoria sp. FACHB-1407]
MSPQKQDWEKHSGSQTIPSPSPNFFAKAQNVNCRCDRPTQDTDTKNCIALLQQDDRYTPLKC